MNRGSYVSHLLATALLCAALPARAGAQCVGDCNRDGEVTAEEIVFGTDVLFDASLLPQCPSFDTNGNQAVASSELVAAVTDAIQGCPIVPGCGNGCVQFDLGENCDDGGLCRGGARDGQRCNENPTQGCDNDPCPDGVCVPVEGNRVSGDACPSNCHINSCSSVGGTLDVRVVFSVPAGKEITSTTVYLRYPDGVLRLPGSGGGQTVQDRISVPSFANYTPNDLDYALQVLLFQFDGSAIPPPELFTVQFDQCQGAPRPSATQFRCVVLDATGTDLVPVTGATCGVEVLP